MITPAQAKIGRLYIFNDSRRWPTESPHRERLFGQLVRLRMIDNGNPRSGSDMPPLFVQSDGPGMNFLRVWLEELDVVPIEVELRQAGDSIPMLIQICSDAMEEGDLDACWSLAGRLREAAGTVGEMERERSEVAGLLKTMQWGGTGVFSGCPTCNGTRQTGHFRGCPLSETLAKIDPKTEVPAS